MTGVLLAVAAFGLTSAFFSSALTGILPAVTGFWVVCCVLTTLVLAVLGGAAFSADLLSAFFGSGFTGTALVDADALLLTFSAGCWLALSAGLLTVAAALAGGGFAIFGKQIQADPSCQNSDQNNGDDGKNNDP